MGHLARQISVALALSDRAEPLFFSMSTAVPIITEHGLRGEYCPSHHRGWLPQTAWHGYLRDRLLAFVAETGPRVLVFDGVAPYLGLLRARAALPEVAFVWARRGMWRPDTNLAALRARPFFDLVIEPGDLAAAADKGATAGLGDSVQVPPITLLEHVKPLPRVDAAKLIGLDPYRPAALVTPGAGSLNDVAAPGAAAVRALLADPEWQIAVTRAHIASEGLPLVDPDRVVELRSVYPLARYFTAFDAAVSAAGYNTFHELLLSRVPTLLVPNRSAATDDQVSRTRWAAEQGLALIAPEDDADAVAAQATRLLDPEVRASLAEACRTLPVPTGASAAARVLTDLADGFQRHRPSSRERLRSVELAFRASAMRALGPSVTGLVRRALGRSVPPGPGRPLRVRLVDETAGASPVTSTAEATPLLFTERLDAAATGSPVEHLLPGSSAGYREQRRRIVERHYDTR